MKTEQKVYGYFFAQDGSPRYVSQLPGDGGVDYGYTSRIEGNNGFDKALPLSIWQRGRFASYCRQTNRQACFIEVAPIVPYVEVDKETAYGSTVRLSRSIRVF